MWLAGGIFAAICLGICFILYTGPGLGLALSFAPDELSVNRYSGTLAAGFILQDIEYRSERVSVQAGYLSFDWRPWQLTGRRVDIRKMEIRDLSIVLTGEPRAGPEPSFFLPLDFNLDAFTAKDIVVQGRSGSENRIPHIFARMHSDQQTVYVEELLVTSPDYRVRTDGKVVFDTLPAYDLSISWDWQFDESVRLTGITGIAGDLDRTVVNTSLQAPFKGDLDLVIGDIPGDLSWQGTASTADLDPSAYLAAAGSQRLALNLSAQGTVKNASIDGTVRLASDGSIGPGYVFTHLDTELNMDIADLAGDHPEISIALQWRELRMSRSGAPVFLAADNGHLRIIYAGGDYRFRSVSGFNFNNESAGKWRISGSGDLSRIHLEEIHLQTEQAKLQGDLTVSGTFDRYTLDLRAMAQADNYPDVRLELRSTGDSNELRLDRIILRLLDGEITGKGSINWMDGLQSRATLQGSGLNPGRYRESWPGTLALDVTAGIELQKEKTRFIIDKLDLSGTLRGLPFEASLVSSIDNGRVNIRQASLRSSSTLLEIKPVPGAMQSYDWRIHAPDLNTVHPELYGHIEGAGRISGTLEHPQLAGRLRAETVRLPWLQIDKLDVQAGINQRGTEELDLQFDIGGLVYREFHLDTLAVVVTGKQGDHRYTLTAAAPAFGLDLAGQGIVADGLWTGKATSLALEHDTLDRWIGSTLPTFRFAKDDLQFDEVCLSRLQAMICSNGSWQDSANWQVGVTAAMIPLHLLQSFLPETIAENIAIDENATSSLELTASHSDKVPMSAKALLRVNPVTVDFLVDGDSVQEIRFDGIDTALTLADGILEANLVAGIPEQGTEPATARARISGLDYLPVDSSSLIIDGAVRWSLQDLSFVSTLSPYLADTAGRLALDFDVSGSLSAPEVSGNFSLLDTAFIVPDLGIKLTDVSAKGHAGVDGAYEITATASSGTDGSISLYSRYRRDSAESGELHATVTGSDFEIVNLPEIRALATTDLDIRLPAGGKIVTKGTIEVTDAVIDLDRMRSQVTVSDDVVFTGREVPVAGKSPARLDTVLQIRLADNIRVQGQGISGGLSGDIQIRSTAEQELIGTGEIRILSGTFSAYGQSLVIEEGRLVYRADPLDNPEIRVTASRRTGEITAGVRVSGRLTNPVISLYSNPSMNEEEILSYIVFGRPLVSLTSGEGMDLISAATAIGLQNSGLLTKSLSSTFGLDELHIDADAGGETLSLVVGKYLTPKLYLSYGIGLLDTISTARIRYDLNSKWSLQATSGEDVGVDIFYRIDR